jgi:hypothetical protein
MLVFYSPESLERLANAQTFFIFMDGTFSVPPHPFKQLYTIRVPFKDVTGTAVYAFLQMSRYFFSLVLVARSFMAFLVFEYLMLVSLGA